MASEVKNTVTKLHHYQNTSQKRFLTATMNSSSTPSRMVVSANGSVDGCTENQDFTSLFRLFVDQMIDKSVPPKRLNRKLEGTTRLLREQACENSEYAANLKGLKEVAAEDWGDDVSIRPNHCGDHTQHNTSIERLLTSGDLITQQPTGRQTSIVVSRKRSRSEAIGETADITDSNSLKRQKLSPTGRYGMPGAWPEDADESYAVAHHSENYSGVEKSGSMSSCWFGMGFGLMFQMGFKCWNERNSRI